LIENFESVSYYLKLILIIIFQCFGEFDINISDYIALTIFIYGNVSEKICINNKIKTEILGQKNEWK